jgi:hypothetical protein
MKISTKCFFVLVYLETEKLSQRFMSFGLMKFNFSFPEKTFKTIIGPFKGALSLFLPMYTMINEKVSSRK